MGLDLNHFIGVFSAESSVYSGTKKITKKDLYFAKKQQELSNTIRFRRLTLLGHIVRLDLSTSAQKAMEKYFDAPYIPRRKNHFGLKAKK